MFPVDVELRFWAKVSDGYGPDACWPWTAAQGGGSGYGVFSINRRSEYAHRVSWAIANGRWPDLDIMHTCDNPICVNPNHLVEGTKSQNSQDMVAKDRVVFGTKQHSAKLDEETVLSMRQMRENGATYAAIAGAVGVARSVARGAILGMTWRRVTQD